MGFHDGAKAIVETSQWEWNIGALNNRLVWLKGEMVSGRCGGWKQFMWSALLIERLFHLLFLGVNMEK